MRPPFSAHISKPRSEFLDFDGDAVTTTCLGDGEIVGEDRDLVVLAALRSMMAPRPSRSTWWTGMVVVPSTTWISRTTLSSVR
jgi:hypothetical protein